MIKSLQGLRVLGMIGIYLFHSGLLLKGTFPVTFFFMLSGFVLYYSYRNKIKQLSIKQNMQWVISRMKKLYPIHLITFAMSIAIRWEWLSKFKTTDILVKAILNIFLLQSLSPQNVFSFNGLSWFLSTTFILYIMAIPLIILIKNIKSIKPQYIIFLILVFQNIIIFINNNKGYELNLYTSPFFRVFDFIIGMLIAKLFISNVDKESKDKSYSLYELEIVCIFCMMYIFTLFDWVKIEYGLSYYSPIFALGIYIIAHEKGVISKILCNNIFQDIAEFSFEFYMVHELILIVFRHIFVDLHYHWLVNNIIISIPSFIVSILLAILFNKYITNKRAFKLRNNKLQHTPEKV